jgi:hypothetical protein
MAEIAPLPRTGDVFVDPRDPDRWLRVSWHGDAAMFVLSTWHRNECVGAAQLAAAEVPRLIFALTSALAADVSVPLSAAG